MFFVNICSHLICTPVPNGARSLAEEEAQPRHVVVIGVSQHAEGLLVWVVTGLIHHNGRNIGRNGLGVLL